MKFSKTLIKNNIYKILIITILLLIYLFVYSSLKEIIFLRFLLNIYHYFFTFIENNYFISIIIAILFFCSWIFFLLPFISLLQILFGFIFNIYAGFFINYISIITGSYLIFLFLSHRITSHLKYLGELETKYKKYQKYLSNKFLFIFLIRLLPGVPFMLQNIFAAIIKTKHKTFLLASCLGIWPFVLINTYFGSVINLLTIEEDFKLNSLNNYFFLFIIAYLVFIIYISKNFKK